MSNNNEPSPLSDCNPSTEVTICSVVGPSAPQLRACGFYENCDVQVVSHHNKNAIYKCNNNNTVMSNEISKNILVKEKKKCGGNCGRCQCRNEH